MLRREAFEKRCVLASYPCSFFCQHFLENGKDKCQVNLLNNLNIHITQIKIQDRRKLFRIRQRFSTTWSKVQILYIKKGFDNSIVMYDIKPYIQTLEFSQSYLFFVQAECCSEDYCNENVTFPRNGSTVNIPPCIFLFILSTTIHLFFTFLLWKNIYNIKLYLFKWKP